MKYAFFLGCNIPARVQQYEVSARAVLERFGIELADFRSFNCCGYPMRNTDQKAFLLSSANNLAIAEKENLDMLVLCKCCYGSLKKAESILKENGSLLSEINRILAQNGLTYEGKYQVKHILSVLYHDVGLDAIKSEVTSPYKNMNIATHYGCHALRPSKITQFDNPVSPKLFDELVKVTGAKSIDWRKKLECCGAPLMGINDELSIDLTQKKLDNGKKSGAHYLVTACPYCHLQFDTVQKKMLSVGGDEEPLASILYPQLLGLTMGIDKQRLGIGMNQLDISDVTSFLVQE
ncbi:MAG TPA: disulfide reductase [Desulfobacteraceae bacterium]|nr:disulfide reductase [Desulfobacteraceae bacterium]